MTTTLITGAGTGLGLETARQLVDAGHTVYLAARDPGRGAAAASAVGGRFVQLDVTDETSVRRAAETVDQETGHLDVLVNNAGISGGFTPSAGTTAADLLRVYDTNVFGVVRVVQAFLPLLERSDSPTVVNVSSGMGSLRVTTDPDRLESTLTGLAYPSSKAALNMLTSQYAKALPHIRVNAVDPGYTATALNGFRGTQTVEQGVRPIVRMAMLGPDGPSGRFVDGGGPIPW